MAWKILEGVDASNLTESDFTKFGTNPEDISNWMDGDYNVLVYTDNNVHNPTFEQKEEVVVQNTDPLKRGFIQFHDLPDGKRYDLELYVSGVEEVKSNIIQMLPKKTLGTGQIYSITLDGAMETEVI